MPGDQPGLALHRSLRLEARACERGGQALGRLVLVEVPRLELDQVHLVGLPDTFQVPPAKHGPLAQVRAQVMNQDAAVDVTPLGLGSLQPNRFHLLRG